MEKHFQVIYLLDIYGGLLTKKQYEILNQYYNEDLSLSEIAETQDVSRQAAFDLLKRSEKILYDYDQKLNLFDKYLRNIDMVDQIKQMCEKNQPDVIPMIDELKENL